MGEQEKKESEVPLEAVDEGKVPGHEPAAGENQKILVELQETKDKYVRLCAEFENARKRFERDKMEFAKYASERIIVDFLGVMDDLERTVQAASANHQNYDAFLKGVEMVMAKVYDLLKKNNVRPIESVGHKFDPHCHEILMQMPTEEHEAGTVLEELQKGYYLGDKVVRTAKVKVAVDMKSTF